VRKGKLIKVFILRYGVEADRVNPDVGTRGGWNESSKSFTFDVELSNSGCATLLTLQIDVVVSVTCGWIVPDGRSTRMEPISFLQKLAFQ
jgi:hypothetical protein